MPLRAKRQLCNVLLNKVTMGVTASHRQAMSMQCEARTQNDHGGDKSKQNQERQSLDYSVALLQVVMC